MGSAAVVALEDAIVAGRSARHELELLEAVANTEDPFIADLLARLPQGCTRLCSSADSVPSEPLLRQQLASQRDHLVAGAFAPPGRSLFGELLGRLFGMFYILGPGQGSSYPDSTSERVRNLQALGDALNTTDRLQPAVQDALPKLEQSLGGECRERASAWMDDARNALIL